MKLTALTLAALTLAALTLTGCTTIPKPPPPPQIVKVPVPVPCQEPVPEKPHMPAHDLTKDDNVERQARASTAEIEIRKGYEKRLETALENCRKPLEVQP